MKNKTLFFILIVFGAILLGEASIFAQSPSSSPKTPVLKDNLSESPILGDSSADTQVSEDSSDEREAGFQGTLSFTYILSNTTSLNQETIQSYDDDHETQSGAFPGPELTLYYVDQEDRDSHWFLQLGDGITFGRAQQTPYGLFTLSLKEPLFPGGDYANPYTLGEARTLTETYVSQRTLDYQFSFGQFGTLSAGYTQLNLNYKDDETPSIDSALGRSFSEETWALGYDLFLLQLQYAHSNRQAEGAADSGTAVLYGLTIILPLSGEELILSVNPRWKTFTYNQKNPIFDKLRVDKENTIETTLAYIDGNYTYYAVGTSTKIDSNIGFFDQEAQSLAIGMSWDF